MRFKNLRLNISDFKNFAINKIKTSKSDKQNTKIICKDD